MEARNKKGQFQKGHKLATGKRKTQVPTAKRLILEQRDEIVQEGLKQALAGENQPLLNWLCQRILRNYTVEGFILPQGTTEEQSKAIVSAIGTVDPQQLETASKILRNHVELTEIAEIKERLEELEQTR